MAHIDEFGIQRTYGVDEVSETNRASHIVTFGAYKQLVIDIDYDKHGLPKANRADGSFGLGVANVPAGTTPMSCILVTRKANSAVNLTAKLCKKTGADLTTPELGEFSVNPTTAERPSTLLSGEGSGIDKMVKEDAYIKVESLNSASELKGLKARLIVEFI